METFVIFSRVLIIKDHESMLRLMSTINLTSRGRSLNKGFTCLTSSGPEKVRKTIQMGVGVRE